MKSVANIFGEAKIKLLRLFTLNPNSTLTSKEIVKRTQEKPGSIQRELRIFLKEGLIKRRAKGFVLDTTYPYLGALENLLVDAAPITWKEVIKRVSRAGNMRLILISGFLLHDRDSRVDLLVVGDRISQAKLRVAISTIEADLGKELRYAVFETPDFQYRLGIYDKLIKDIFDFRHEKLLNKLGI